MYTQTDQLLEPLKTEELGSSSDIHQAEMKHTSWSQERGAAITKLRQKHSWRQPL
ncbi:hypothetical protein DPMN_116617 [Dreissena polymorpha]|uniref:Uncharacterized protein n=1 Tax=Dreissena polymorpha TaxID=45954 RepID=A0A9D4KNC6_DREPO|nr:hypothetical protein DPMN_116617 [Dreissena polymorpha]